MIHAAKYLDKIGDMDSGDLFLFPGFNGSCFRIETRAIRTGSHAVYARNDERNGEFSYGYRDEFGK